MDVRDELIPVSQLSGLKLLIKSQISEQRARNGPHPAPHCRLLTLSAPLGNPTSPRRMVPLTMGITGVFSRKETVSFILFVRDIAQAVLSGAEF
jgi:hypothetical protein